MRFNEAEVCSLATVGTPEWEGKLTYKSPKGGSSFLRTEEYKDRYFKLRANCLFYYRIPQGAQDRPAQNTEPMGVLVLEGSHVQQEGFAESVHAFSIIFADEAAEKKKHMFLADSQRHVTQWISALKKARYYNRIM